MENLKTEVLEDLKIAMREKNASKLEAIRAVKSAIDKFEKEKLSPGNEMSFMNYANALRPLVKQREDSMNQFISAEKFELANREAAEIAVINSYLLKVMPKKLSEEEVETIAKKYVVDNSLGKNDMGKIMSYFKSNFDGQYDGKELSVVAKTVLQ
jgi:hypothetical protein